MCVCKATIAVTLYSVPCSVVVPVLCELSNVSGRNIIIVLCVIISCFFFFFTFFPPRSRERPDGVQSENRALQEQTSGDDESAVGGEPTRLGEKAVRAGGRAEQGVREQVARAQALEEKTIAGRQLFAGQQRHRTQKGMHERTSNRFRLVHGCLCSKSGQRLHYVVPKKLHSC